MKKLFYILIYFTVIQIYSQTSGGSANSKVFSISDDLLENYYEDQDGDGNPDFLIDFYDDNLSLSGRGLEGKKIVIEIFKLTDENSGYWSQWVNGDPAVANFVIPTLDIKDHLLKKGIRVSSVGADL
ncbi:hypothetical protein, partial [Polaribacter sp.]|uniref:hypothetical protein n=1 Tax=Polaribacter sp. TaxID=1920175 RepID=UPI0025F87CC4